MGSLRVDTGVGVPGGDGTTLATDVMRPAEPGRFPAILMRTAYDRTSYASVGLQVHALRLSAAGYAVVLQDVRGRGASGGLFTPFVNEQEDGVSLVHWVAEQPWCNGIVGMAGVSYNAFCQLAVAAAAPDPLAAWVPGLTPCDVRTSWIREGGALNYGFHLSWGLGALLPADRRAGHLPTTRAFAEPIETAQRGIEGQVELAASEAGRWFFEWAASVDPYPGDQRVPCADDLTAVRAPALVVAGWYDVFSPGSIELHRSLSNEDSGAHALAIGAWDHTGLPLGRVSGDVDFGPEAAIDLHQLQQEWFDVHLRGAGPPELTRVFVTGRNAWEVYEVWPPPARRVSWYPSRDGSLGREAPDPDSLSVTLSAADPAPSLGGRVYPWEPVLRPGPRGRASVRARDDVAAFDSGPLPEPMVVAGPVALEATFTTEGPAADVVAVVLDVAPDGTAINVADGIARVSVSEGGTTSVEMTMGHVAHEYRRGHRIGLDLACAAFPRFDLAQGGRARSWLFGPRTRLLLPEST